MGKLAFMVSVGTGMGWVEGHTRVPLLCATLRAVCDLCTRVGSGSSVLSIFCTPGDSSATQSGKIIFRPSTPPLHCAGGSAEPALSSPVPQYHLMRLPLMFLAVMILRLARKGLNAWCELFVRDLSGRCPRIRVGLPIPIPEGKGTDSSCSMWTPSSPYSTSWSTTSASPAHKRNDTPDRMHP